MSNQFAVQDAKSDNLTYFRGILNRVKAQHSVDSKRIYAMGLSNGCMFVQRLVLEETETFAAAASTITRLPEAPESGFQPKAPLSVLFISGTEDLIMPFHGGVVVFHIFRGNEKRRWEQSQGRVVPVRKAAQRQVGRSKIGTPEKDSLLPGSNPSDGFQMQRHLWRDDTNGPSVVLYGIIGGGRTPPKIETRTPDRLVGKTCAALYTTKLLWQLIAG
jgi:polyhydroxybutyrate depolymerase